MADIKISAMTALTGANLADDDVFEVVDTSATENKKMTATELADGLARKLQESHIDDITTTASSGTLPTADGTVTIADAASPTNAELLEYCVELEAKIEALLSALETMQLLAAS